MVENEQLKVLHKELLKKSKEEGDKTSETANIAQTNI